MASPMKTDHDNNRDRHQKSTTSLDLSDDDDDAGRSDYIYIYALSISSLFLCRNVVSLILRKALGDELMVMFDWFCRKKVISLSNFFTVGQ